MTTTGTPTTPSTLDPWTARLGRLMETMGGVDLPAAHARTLWRLASCLDDETLESLAHLIEQARDAAYDDGMNSVWQCRCNRCVLHYAVQLHEALVRDEQS